MSNPGYGLWHTEEKMWLRATDGADECAMVWRTLEEAQREAKRQSKMYDIYPIIAAPFNWDAEVKREEA